MNLWNKNGWCESQKHEPDGISCVLPCDSAPPVHFPSIVAMVHFHTDNPRSVSVAHVFPVVMMTEPGRWHTSFNWIFVSSTLFLILLVLFLTSFPVSGLLLKPVILGYSLLNLYILAYRYWNYQTYLLALILCYEVWRIQRCFRDNLAVWSISNRPCGFLKNRVNHYCRIYKRATRMKKLYQIP